MRSSTARKVLAAALGGWLSVTCASAAELVFPAGKESQIAKMLGQNGGLPEGCVWMGGSIDPRVARSRYQCGSAIDLVLELYPPDAAVTADVRTEKFLLVRGSPQIPRELVDAIAANVRAHEVDWQWGEGQAGNPRAELLQFYVTTAALIGWLLVATVWLIGARARAAVWRAAGAAKPEPMGVVPLVYLAVVGAAVLVLSMAAHARFVWDDFRFLLRAAETPWRPDESLAFFTTTLPYWAGTRLRAGVGLYATVNAATWGLAVTLWGWLTRRASFSKAEAALAAALFAVGPGTFELVRWPAGFQQLAAYALIASVLLVVDTGAQAHGASARAERWGWFAMATALTALGTQIKFAVTALVPVLAWLWGRFIVRSPAKPFDRHWPYGVIAGAYALSLIAGGVDVQRGDRAAAGTSELGRNAAQIAVFLGANVRGLLLAALVGITLHYVLRRLRVTAESPSHLRAELRAALRSKFGKAPLVAVALIAPVFLVFPFLFNQQYVMPYYALLAYAPIAALGARVLIAVSPTGWRGWVVGLAIVASMVPFAALRRNLEPNEWNRCQQLLEDAGAVLTSRDRSNEVVLQAHCPTCAATRASDESLHALVKAADNENGFRWATGWDDLHVRIEDAMRSPDESDASIRLLYCGGRFSLYDPAAP